MARRVKLDKKQVYNTLNTRVEYWLIILVTWFLYPEEFIEFDAKDGKTNVPNL